MAPVICVTVSQPLGRTILNNSSRSEKILGTMNPDAERRVQAERSGDSSNEIHQHCLFVRISRHGSAPLWPPIPSMSGSWTFTTAVLAPWADPQRKPDDAERARLMGKTVVLKSREISGPRPFACARPQYKVTDYGPDMLFQGAFDEMQRADKKTDPKALAASLGFTGSRIRTLETGCEIDVHFVDDATAEIGLNDYVYALKKR